MSMPEETPRETLADRLREGPEPNDLLWRLYWGESNKAPAIFETLARDLLNPSRSAHVLISGRYGSGKTSFIEALRKRLEQPDSPDSPDRAPLQLFLPMPLVTGNTGTTPAAAIIGAIVEGSVCVKCWCYTNLLFRIERRWAPMLAATRDQHLTQT